MKEGAFHSLTREIKLFHPATTPAPEALNISPRPKPKENGAMTNTPESFCHHLGPSPSTTMLAVSGTTWYPTRAIPVLRRCLRVMDSTW